MLPLLSKQFYNQYKSSYQNQQDWIDSSLDSFISRLKNLSTNLKKPTIRVEKSYYYQDINIKDLIGIHKKEQKDFTVNKHKKKSVIKFLHKQYNIIQNQKSQILQNQINKLSDLLSIILNNVKEYKLILKIILMRCITFEDQIQQQQNQIHSSKIIQWYYQNVMAKEISDFQTAIIRQVIIFYKLSDNQFLYMICYKRKFFSIEKDPIFKCNFKRIIKDQHSLVIQLYSFEPKINWIKNDNSDLISFELCQNKNKQNFKFAPHIGKLLKEFMNGKVCFQGINNHYKIAQYIQKRNYGSIVRMRNIFNEELVTCKILKQGTAEQELVFRNEVIALQFLNHKNIPKLKEYYIESHHNYIIYEFIEGASLDNFIKKNILNKDQIYKIMKDLLAIVKYLHKEGFSHQNIKLENVFYCSIQDHITLIDFGQSKIKNIIHLKHVSSIYTEITQDQTNANTDSNRESSMEQDYKDCGIVFLQLQAILNKFKNNSKNIEQLRIAKTERKWNNSLDCY
ncbi:unnamed protein product (macronuclear) [Paramecium tetraurelia]|uniref:Protein kinase domain-containing protein n=1 Tax=Paramecium tetraurelia TaxID=5888 RepID=A0D1F5_PARTE|nr:uncharacterized protein GSPATT00012396001 [Paramecium tetraurelia]CAK76872.1 unnamed protein product [Paramecium tetraurelia]|eukprot:XP_001444269.1 hypothetical protein (macronuclear) [Paramecium tetraurelia strain d4-2]